MTGTDRKICKANGCPLLVEFITDWDKGRPKWGVCRYHSMSEGREWSRVTARVLEYHKMIVLFRAIELIKEPLCLQLPGESARDWIDRVNDNLRRVITGQRDNVNGPLNFAECYKSIYGDKRT